MERYCSKGQSPQRAVAPTEEEEFVTRDTSRHAVTVTRLTSCNCAPVGISRGNSMTFTVC